MSSKKSSQGTVDQRLIKALGHPLRQRILNELNRRTASPTELADALDEPLGNVSYHVKILAECDAIELVSTTQVRGAVEHFYRAIALPRLDEVQWTQLPAEARRALSNQTLAQIWQHVLEANKDGGFEDPRAHIVWAPLELDDDGFGQMVSALEELLDRALAIQAKSRQRLSKLPEEERRSYWTELDLLHYPRERRAGD
jgi:DNA-binding transcriptional ArsR family regulator